MDVDEDVDAAGRPPEPVDRVAPTTPVDRPAPPPDRPAVVGAVDPGAGFVSASSARNVTTSDEKDGHDAEFFVFCSKFAFLLVFSVPERETFFISRTKIRALNL